MAPDLTLAERVMLLDKIGAATDSRDRCLERLKLDTKAEPDVWTIIQTAQKAVGREVAAQDDTKPVPNNGDGGGHA